MFYTRLIVTTFICYPNRHPVCALEFITMNSSFASIMYGLCLEIVAPVGQPHLFCYQKYLTLTISSPSTLINCSKCFFNDVVSFSISCHFSKPSKSTENGQTKQNFITFCARNEISSFANSVDSDEVAQNEPPHLNLHCLPSIL